MSRPTWLDVPAMAVLTGWALSAVASAALVQLSDPGATRPPHLQVHLVSEASTVAPGRRFWIGLDFALDPGWHIYWVNAGDSGEPPHVAWTAPAGYHVGPLEWPVPSRIADSETIVDYGYQGQVLLMAPVSVPSSVRSGTSAVIAAEVSWLVCRDICMPGKTRLSLPMPVAAEASLDAALHARFEATRRQVPKPMPATWKASAASTGGSYEMTIETGRAEKSATFFPLDDSQVDNAAPQRVQVLGRGVRLTVKKAEASGKTAHALKGVLAFPSGSPYVVNIPVK